MPTAQAQINRALKINGIIAENDTPKDSVSNTAFTVLNSMLDLWNTEQLMVYQFQDETHTLVAGTGSYTIGSGGTINTVRPVRIQGGHVVDSEGVSTPIRVINKDDYDGIPDKAQGGLPSVLYYDSGYPLGTINLYQVPDAASTLHLKTWAPFTAFANLSTNINLPPGYDLLLVYWLAILLASEFDSPIRPDVKEIALDAKAKVETLNNMFQRKNVKFDRSFSVGR